VHPGIGQRLRAGRQQPGRGLKLCQQALGELGGTGEGLPGMLGVVLQCKLAGRAGGRAGGRWGGQRDRTGSKVAQPSKLSQLVQIKRGPQSTTSSYWQGANLQPLVCRLAGRRRHAASGTGRRHSAAVPPRLGAALGPSLDWGWQSCHPAGQEQRAWMLAYWHGCQAASLEG
jgi:hypothetical protein